MEFYYIDKNPELVEVYKNIIGDISYYLDNSGRKHKIINKFFCCDVNHIPNLVEKKETIDYLVSPANSYGIMNGGIDLVYMRMFPEQSS